MQQDVLRSQIEISMLLEKLTSARTAAGNGAGAAQCVPGSFPGIALAHPQPMWSLRP